MDCQLFNVFPVQFADNKSRLALVVRHSFGKVCFSASNTQEYQPRMQMTNEEVQLLPVAGVELPAI